ncbi:MAG: CopG family transcriptional regulator [Legionella sp.]|jgi:metal-responsive CopG/Arc/MetJ family transcriptional regulator|nr:CopG family transcriptional regulator [Legionella sp.]
MHVDKIAISMDHELLKKLDQLVLNKEFKTRSQAIQVAVRKIVDLSEHESLAKACSQLDVVFEQQLADEDLDEDVDAWPEF